MKKQIVLLLLLLLAFVALNATQAATDNSSDVKGKAESVSNSETSDVNNDAVIVAMLSVDNTTTGTFQVVAGFKPDEVTLNTSKNINGKDLIWLQENKVQKKNEIKKDEKKEVKKDKKTGKKENTNKHNSVF